MIKKLVKKSGLFYIDPSGKIQQGANSLLRGDCSGLSGDLDECEISDEDRSAIIDINDLIGE